MSRDDQNERIFQNFNRSTDARLARIERTLGEVVRALNITIAKENEMTINFDGLAAALTKLQGAEASTKKLVDDMNAKLAELSASISNPEDQAKVDDFAAKFAAEADNLPQAVAANP